MMSEEPVCFVCAATFSDACGLLDHLSGEHRLLHPNVTDLNATVHQCSQLMSQGAEWISVKALWREEALRAAVAAQV